MFTIKRGFSKVKLHNFSKNLYKLDKDQLNTKDYLKLTDETLDKINDRIQAIFDEKNVKKKN